MVILSQDDGKRVRVSSGSTDYDTAQRELTKRMGQVDRGEVIDTRRGPTCGDLWQGLERHYRIQKRKSTECLPRRWKHLQPTFGEKNQRLRLVPDFPHLAENNVRSGFIEDQQFEALTAQCTEAWLRLFLEIAYTFAWRKSEILNLRVSNVSIAERTIRLDAGTTKNNAGREMTMSANIAVLAALAIAGKAPDDYLITRADGLRVGDFRKAWSTITATAGLKGKLVHDLRRSGARQLRRAGVPESVVQAIGGWKTAATFKRYAIVSNADQREAMEKLEQARENNSSRHSLGHSSTENEATTIPGGSGKVQ